MLGQTGSGKTHTMTFLEERAAECIFAVKKSCKVSFVELRAGRCYDLLYQSGNAGVEVQIREQDRGVYGLVDANEVVCNSAKELQHWMEAGHGRRHTEITAANRGGSSRSHACIIIAMDDCKLILV